MGQQGVWGAVRVGREGVRQQRNNAVEWHVASDLNLEMLKSHWLS